MKPLTAEQATDVCMGAGGPDCCIYVACGPQGFGCIRNTSMGDVMLSRALAGTSSAQWVPGDECRIPEVAA